MENVFVIWNDFKSNNYTWFNHDLNQIMIWICPSLAHGPLLACPKYLEGHLSVTLSVSARRVRSLLGGATRRCAIALSDTLKGGLLRLPRLGGARGNHTAELCACGLWPIHMWYILHYWFSVSVSVSAEIRSKIRPQFRFRPKLHYCISAPFRFRQNL